MRWISCLTLAILVGARAAAAAAGPPPTEESFRKTIGVGPTVQMAYRDLDCKAVKFSEFAAAMANPNAHADVDRAADGSALTLTVRMRGNASCPSPYPQITEMPALDLPDLAGRRVTSAGLRGKPTLISFFFSTCVPCILEVQPINKFAAQRPHMNFLAVTFDEADVAKAFVKRYDLRWRVVPGARDFIDRVRIKQYPVMALFDAKGKLLGFKQGGARDELEAANVEPQLARWIDGLLPKK